MHARERLRAHGGGGLPAHRVRWSLRDRMHGLAVPAGERRRCCGAAESQLLRTAARGCCCCLRLAVGLRRQLCNTRRQRPPLLAVVRAPSRFDGPGDCGAKATAAAPCCRSSARAVRVHCVVLAAHLVHASRDFRIEQRWHSGRCSHRVPPARQSAAWEALDRRGSSLRPREQRPPLGGAARERRKNGDDHVQRDDEHGNGVHRQAAEEPDCGAGARCAPVQPPNRTAHGCCVSLPRLEEGLRCVCEFAAPPRVRCSVVRAGAPESAPQSFHPVHEAVLSTRGPARVPPSSNRLLAHRFVWQVAPP